MVQVHYVITSGKAWGRQAFDLKLERQNQGPELIQELSGAPRESPREKGVPQVGKMKRPMAGLTQGWVAASESHGDGPRVSGEPS